jgi:hypothetical protein
MTKVDEQTTSRKSSPVMGDGNKTTSASWFGSGPAMADISVPLLCAEAVFDFNCDRDIVSSVIIGYARPSDHILVYSVTIRKQIKQRHTFNSTRARLRLL